MKTHLAKWGAVYLRTIIYSMISGLTVWATAIGDMSGPQMWEFLGARWLPLTLASALAVATVIRAQLDQSIGRIKQSPTPQKQPETQL